MRVAVISDLHGNTVALEAVLRDIEKHGVDATICCGDLVAFGPRPAETLDLLDSVSTIQLIRGNTERWLELVQEGRKPYGEKIIGKIEPCLQWTLEKLGSRIEPFLAACPPTLDIGFEGLRAYVRHAGYDSDVQGILPETDLGPLADLLEEEKCDIFLCGHTHRPFVRKAGRTTFVNAGSTGLPFDGTPRPSWALLEIENKKLKARILRVDYKMDEAIEQLEQCGMPMAHVMIERMQKARM
jgi:predicted phosphodiesterase